MSLPANTPLTFRTLYESPIVKVRNFHCRACRGGPGAEEYSDSNNIVLLRRGAFCKHFGRRSVTADANQAVFFSKGSSYGVSHPADCGDRGTVFVVSPGVLVQIVRELDPSVEAHPHRPFPFITGPCNSSVFRRHREFVQRLETAETEPLEHLWADVTALQLMADTLEAAYARREVPRKHRRRGTHAAHTDQVEAVKVLLARRVGERVTLDEVARAVHSSPFHLARLFQQQTGVPIHRYLTRLRLRAAADRLAEGAADLTRLALDLGFSSHSHFSDAFRREFGCAPSKARALKADETSKNLKV